MVEKKNNKRKNLYNEIKLNRLLEFERIFVLYFILCCVVAPFFLDFVTHREDAISFD